MRLASTTTIRFDWLEWSLNRDGRLAQLGEHRVRNAGVGGSNRLPSTNLFYHLRQQGRGQLHKNCAFCPRSVVSLSFLSLQDEDFQANLQRGYEKQFWFFYESRGCISMLSRRLKRNL